MDRLYGYLSSPGRLGSVCVRVCMCVFPWLRLNVQSTRSFDLPLNTLRSRRNGTTGHCYQFTFHSFCAHTSAMQVIISSLCNRTCFAKHDTHTQACCAAVEVLTKEVACVCVCCGHNKGIRRCPHKT